jgi:hypothetical protein
MATPETTPSSQTVRAIAALLQDAQGRTFNPDQAAELEEILVDLEHAIGTDDHAALVKLRGDIETLSGQLRWTPLGQRSGAALPVRQRERVARLVPALIRIADPVKQPTPRRQRSNDR